MGEELASAEIETTDDAVRGAPGRFAALRYRDFRLYWGGQAVSSTGAQMQQAAVAWQVYLLTHSPAALGLVGLFRVFPIVIFSLWGGVVADVIDRRRLLLATQTALLALSVALAATTLTGTISIWTIFGLTALGAAALAFDNPARQALVPSLVPPERLTNAISLSSTTFQVATIVGPSAAGLMIAQWGIGSVYVINAVTFLAFLAALVQIHPPPVQNALPRVSLAAALEGLRFVFTTPILLWTMSLDFVATFFGSAMALLPIFAKDILHAGPQGYGMLYAAPSVGAVVTGLFMSTRGGEIRAKGRVILIAVGLYGAFTIVFGLSRSLALSLLALAGTGAADTVSMIVRQTIRQTITPNAMRGRMTSVSMVFFMGGPQLGEFEAGMVARAFGATFSVVSGGVAAVIATCLIARQARSLREYRDAEA